MWTPLGQSVEQILAGGGGTEIETDGLPARSELNRILDPLLLTGDAKISFAGRGEHQQPQLLLARLAKGCELALVITDLSRKLGV